MSLHTRLLIVIGATLIFVFAGLEYYSFHAVQEEARRDLLREATKVRAVMMATRRVYYEQFLDSGLPLTEKTIGFLPALAINKISKNLQPWDISGFSVRHVSDRPRSVLNIADKPELEAMGYFRNNPAKKVYSATVTNQAGESLLLYASPIWIEEFCLKCHGSREDAPPSIREMYDTAYDYKVGDLRGLLSIKLPASSISERIWGNFKREFITHLSVFLLLFGLVTYQIKKYVHRPLTKLVAGMGELARGDYKKRVGSLEGEFGQLSGAFNKMAEKIEQHRAKLTESEGQFYTVVKNSTPIIFTFNKDGKILLSEGKMLEAVGQKPGEVVGQSIFEMYKDYPDVIKALKIPLSGSEYEGVVKIDDHFFEAFYSPLRDAKGDVTGVIGMALDITERKRSEDERKKTNRMLRMISDCNQALIRSKNEQELLDDVCEIVVKEGGYRLAWVGYAKHDEEKSVLPTAQAGFEVGYLETLNITWADTERGRGPAGTSIRTGKPRISRNILTDPDFAPWREEARKRGYASVIGLPIITKRGESGSITVYSSEPDAFDETETSFLTELADDVAYGIDTLRTREEREQAEKSIRQSEEKLAEAQRMAHIGNWELNLKTSELSWSEGIFSIFEIDKKRFGASYEAFLDAIHPDDRESVSKAYADSLENKTAYDITHRLLLSDGRIKYVHEKCNTFYDDDGAPTRSVGTVQDVTERKLAEEERRKLETHVQHAEEARKLGMLAGGVAHDFNNLLFAILGNTDLALDELPPSSPARGNIEDIQNTAKLASNLSRQMLAYSGRGKFNIAIINLNEFIAELIDLLKASIPKKIIVEYNLADDLPLIEADSTQLNQVILNLITNASEAIGNKKGSITVTTYSMKSDSDSLAMTYFYDDTLEGVCVCLEVRDSGIGMDEETRNKMFDPFYSTKPTGRGLGMPTLLGIVRGHKGAIKVESEPSKGSTITVMLPSTDKSVVEEKEKVRDEVNIDSFVETGILLFIDDEKYVRKVGGKILKKLGFSVLMAANGKKGVEIFRERSDEIALVILDLTMPVMDGEECFAQLKQIKEDVRVILTSGYDKREVSEKFSGKEVAGFLQKPFQIATLKDAIYRALEE